VAAVWGTAARARSRRPVPIDDWRMPAALLVAMIVLIGVLPPMLLLADWGGSLQKTVALLAWTTSVAFVARARRGSGRRLAIAAVACVVVMTATSTAGIAARGRTPNGRL